MFCPLYLLSQAFSSGQLCIALWAAEHLEQSAKTWEDPTIAKPGYHTPGAVSRPWWGDHGKKLPSECWSWSIRKYLWSPPVCHSSALGIEKEKVMSSSACELLCWGAFTYKCTRYTLQEVFLLINVIFIMMGLCNWEVSLQAPGFSQP